MLRMWRERRRLSQLVLAVDAEVSQRHLSFIESGRSQPSREMLLRLADGLSVPMRDRNLLLVAAGFAPLYEARSWEAPELKAAREAVERIVHGHLPHPALAVDRHWNLVMANKAAQLLMASAANLPSAGPLNVLKLSLHPKGLAGRILNFAEWRAHLITRLTHDVERSADARLAELLEELKQYPAPAHRAPAHSAEDSIVVPLRLEGPDGPLSFISTTTVFGTAVDVTLAEITIESFFPSDAATAATMARLVAPA